MLRLKRVSEMYDMEIFTESGELFGVVEEVIIIQSRIHSWKVMAAKNSALTRLLGSAKGVIVPHQLINAIGDIVIVSDNALPSTKPEED